MVNSNTLKISSDISIWWMGVIILSSGDRLAEQDIYIGKSDAKDELLLRKSDEFLDSYMILANFSFDNIINKDKIFICGSFMKS